MRDTNNVGSTIEHDPGPDPNIENNFPAETSAASHWLDHEPNFDNSPIIFYVGVVEDIGRAL